AKEKKAGRSVNTDQLQSYRSGLKAKQDAFLSSLSANGVSYQFACVNVPNFDGSNAGHVDFRYSLVLNGLSLKVPASAINLIRSMPQVKKVEPNRQYRVQL